MSWAGRGLQRGRPGCSLCRPGFGISQFSAECSHAPRASTQPQRRSAHAGQLTRNLRRSGLAGLVVGGPGCVPVWVAGYSQADACAGLSHYLRCAGGSWVSWSLVTHRDSGKVGALRYVECQSFRSLRFAGRCYWHRPRGFAGSRLSACLILLDHDRSSFCRPPKYPLARGPTAVTGIIERTLSSKMPARLFSWPAPTIPGAGARARASAGWLGVVIWWRDGGAVVRGGAGAGGRCWCC